MFCYNLIKIIVGLVGLSNFATCQFPGCDFYKLLNTNERYQILSPGSSDGYIYQRNTRCRWGIEAPTGYKVRAACDYFMIPQTTRCAGDAFIISKRGMAGLSDGQRYCGGAGKVNFSFDSDNTQMFVSLQSTFNSRGGKFRCFFSVIPNPNNSNNCVCGARNSGKFFKGVRNFAKNAKEVKNQGRIVNGTETFVNEYPMMAGVVDSLERTIICGAIIISQTRALSAAHCFERRQITQLGLLVGEHNTASGTETPYTFLYRISNFLKHPSYNPNSGINDIGLVITDRPITFYRGVGAACLPFKFRYSTFVESTVIAAGWGHDDYGGKPSKVLKHVFLNVIYSTKCTKDQICTYTRYKDTCQQDSGGPLFLYSNGLIYIVGIIVEGIACATPNPGINTRVTSYLDWIQKNTPELHCNRKK